MRALVLAAALTLLAACGSDAGSGPEPQPTTPAPTTSATPSSAATSASGEPVNVTGVEVAGRIGGFDTPWDLQFLPDGTPLLTERPGRVVTIRDGKRAVVGEVPGVVASGEGGLTGLAIDPKFEQNRSIYVCHTYGSAGRAVDVRVERFRLAKGLDALTDGKPLVTGIPTGAGNRHQGCRLAIGPDGMLWISTGDSVQPDVPQDPKSRGGKVLRATLSGDPAPGNPGGSWDPYVYTMGHRNVQGLTFRPSDGTPFSVEHGTSCDDEVNILRAGANYGWDPRGPGGAYAENAPMTSPRIEGAVPAIWSSGCPTVAPSGADFITGAEWGSWVGRLAIAVLKDQELLVMSIEGERVTHVDTELAGQLGRLRTVRNAPDGSLWLTEDASPADVVRIVPTR